MKIITYILLAALLAVSGYAAVQWTINQSNESKITNLETRVHAAEGSLSAIQAANTVSDTLSSQLSEMIGKINDKGVVINERVVKMERENEQVRDLLGTALPDAGCMLDDTCGAASSASTIGASTGNVQAPTPGKVRGRP
jgi:hypothetical protein